MAAGSFGDSFDASREQHFTRAACAELLIDAGAVVAPSVCDGLIASRASGLLELFRRKGLLPRIAQVPCRRLAISMPFVRALTNPAHCVPAPATPTSLPPSTRRSCVACRFQHKAVASLLLERCIALDADLGRRIDGWQGRSAFIEYLGEHPERVRKPLAHACHERGPAGDCSKTICRHSFAGCRARAVPARRSRLWTFRSSCSRLPPTTIAEPFIAQLLDLDPAMLQRRHRPPPSTAARIRVRVRQRPSRSAAHAHLAAAR